MYRRWPEVSNVQCDTKNTAMTIGDRSSEKITPNISQHPLEAPQKFQSYFGPGEEPKWGEELSDTAFLQ